jgi:putative tryptophan/tyrosine transport system substrate-binding protein
VNSFTLLGGTAVAWPFAARAQQKAMPVIGYLHFGSAGPFAYQAAAFREGLSETGYIEGQNVTIEARCAEGHYDRLPAMAADLVTRKVDVVATVGPSCAHAAKDATATIPIVFMVGTDPVADGLIASLARPGGNLTGASMLAFDLTPKRLELLLDLVPQARVIALLVNPNNAYAEHMIGDAQEAARTKGVQLPILKPVPKARSTSPSPRSANCMPMPSSSTPSRSSATGSSSSWRLHHAMPFRRSMRGVNTPQPVA